MRCRDVESLCSDYVDGELDERRASALRGHLRVCPPCLARVEDEAAVRDAAADLDVLEPPDTLWGAVEARLAAAEIGDDQRSRLWLWWQGFRPYAMPVAVVAAAILVVVVWSQRRVGSAAERAETSTHRPVVAVADDHVEPPATLEQRTFLEQRSLEISEADADYAAVLHELKEIVAEERASWSAEVVAGFDRELDGFEAAARQQRQQLAVNQPPDPASRDALYAVYRAEIGFLQRAALGELR